MQGLACRAIRHLHNIARKLRTPHAVQALRIYVMRMREGGFDVANLLIKMRQCKLSAGPLVSELNSLQRCYVVGHRSGAGSSILLKDFTPQNTPTAACNHSVVMIDPAGTEREPPCDLAGGAHGAGRVSRGRQYLLQPRKGEACSQARAADRAAGHPLRRLPQLQAAAPGAAIVHCQRARPHVAHPASHLHSWRMHFSHGKMCDASSGSQAPSVCRRSLLCFIWQLNCYSSSSH